MTSPWCSGVKTALEISFDYELPVPESGTCQLVLDNDELRFGGQGRVDHAFVYPVNGNGMAQWPAPARTELVYPPAE